MADLGPSTKRIAQLLRLLGTSQRGERVAAFTALERTLQGANISWTDLGDAVEHDGDGKYTESEMMELAAAARAEGVERGIEIGVARAASNNGGSNGPGLSLPPPSEMAQFLKSRWAYLKDNREREFTDEMVQKTAPISRMFIRNHLKPGTIGYLALLYIKHGGRT